ncbi:hypothetical protein [Georgenia yuyongxinii]|uniref:Uncharacterized protein n=1 Tax=Georgenia yuyongxinii TaxID=2589797 RepID=A0A552WUA0_9MICO|nr:hypothetical protein [Georgenia yuyongxinii]TRW45903.1 hypothetical protein FJ693_07800 [Georgenia yuyongxinii]
MSEYSPRTLQLAEAVRVKALTNLGREDEIARPSTSEGQHSARARSDGARANRHVDKLRRTRRGGQAFTTSAETGPIWKMPARTAFKHPEPIRG